MAETAILLFMYVDICIFLGFYLYLRRIKKLIGFQLGMNISIVMGGMIALLSENNGHHIWKQQDFITMY